MNNAPNNETTRNVMVSFIELSLKEVTIAEIKQAIEITEPKTAKNFGKRTVPASGFVFLARETNALVIIGTSRIIKNLAICLTTNLSILITPQQILICRTDHTIKL